MRILENSNWAIERQNGIGSTDAATILGLNPYSDVETLLWQKVFRISTAKENRYVKHGQVLEQYIRNFLNRKHGWNLQPMFLMSDEYDFMRASVDGIDMSRRILVEIKCPRRRYGGIPIYYYIQVQHQLLVTGYEKAMFIVYRNNKLEIMDIDRNERAISVLMEKEIDFWKRVLELREIHGEKQVPGVEKQHSV